MDECINLVENQEISVHDLDIIEKNIEKSDRKRQQINNIKTEKIKLLSDLQLKLDVSLSEVKKHSDLEK